MLSLLCLLNVYETSTTVTQTTETKANAAEEEEKTDENKLSRRENSPRLCLLALESLRASLWPMELRKIIASATSPSCIVLVTFLAAQGPPAATRWSRCDCGWRHSSPGQVNTSAAGKEDPSSSPVALLSRYYCTFPTPPFLCLFHSSDCCVRKSVKWRVMLRLQLQTSPRHNKPSRWW